MNLIEQLGGYEASKNILLRKRYDHVAYSVDSNSFYDHEAAEHGGIDVRDLDDELLEYRRENNIFEVRDRVVSTLNGDEDWKNIVCEVLGFHKSMAITTGFSCAIHHYEYRHATPEEIQAGRRL